MTENSKMGSHENSGCREEKIRDGQRDSDRDRLCLEDAVVFILVYLLTLFFPLLLHPPPPSTSFTTFHFLRGRTAVQQQPF